MAVKIEDLPKVIQEDSDEWLSNHDVLKLQEEAKRRVSQEMQPVIQQLKDKVAKLEIENLRIGLLEKSQKELSQSREKALEESESAKKKLEDEKLLRESMVVKLKASQLKLKSAEEEIKERGDRIIALSKECGDRARELEEFRRGKEQAEARLKAASDKNASDVKCAYERGCSETMAAEMARRVSYRDA